MLVDMHTHTAGVSRCCRIPAEGIVERAKENGIDGIVLTNHYVKGYLNDISLDDFIKKYIDEYYYTAEKGKKIGVKVYFGMEITMEFNQAVHILIYGVDENFLYDNPTAFDYTQKELYTAVKNAGGVMVQAHPFRNSTTVLDTAYLDGIEINSHSAYGNSYSAEILKIAKKNNLIVTSGGDYHGDTYRPKCGMYLPDDLKDGIAVGKYLLTSNKFELCVHEPNTETPVKMDHFKKL